MMSGREVVLNSQLITHKSVNEIPVIKQFGCVCSCLKFLCTHFPQVSAWIN